MPVCGHAYLAKLLSPGEGPCISIYQPTHRSHPQNDQDPIRFGNLVRRAEESLRRAYSGRQVGPVLERLNALRDDAKFWNHTLDGLAVFASMDRFDALRFPRTAPEFVGVADSWHVKPLLRYTQSADRFHLLAISRDTVAAYEGNRYGLMEIPFPEFSADLPRSSDHRAESRPGQGADGYFRAIDGAVEAGLSKPTGLPLVLAGLPDNTARFRSVSRNAAMLDADVAIDPFAVSVDDLRARAWSAMEPAYIARLAELARTFEHAASKQQGTADLSDAARAAAAGRIATLLIDSDKSVAASIDRATGALKTRELADPAVDDALDDLAEMVLRTGGSVVVAPGERMPTPSGLAAIYRF